MEKKPANSLVVPLVKALDGTPHPTCGRQVVGPSSLSIAVAQPDKMHAAQPDERHADSA